MLTAAGSALVEDDGPRKMDAVLVFGGDDDCQRIVKAAQLAQAGYAPFVIVSGPKVYGWHETDLTIPVAEKQGYPASLFHPVPNDSDSTRTESRILGNYLNEHGIRRILLVTSNYHTRRAARLFRNTNPGIQVSVVPAPDPFFSPGGWWKTRSGKKTFLLEWTKTVATWLGE